MLLVWEKDEFPAEIVRVSASLWKIYWELLQKDTEFKGKWRPTKTAISTGSVDTKVCITKFSVA